MSIAPFSPPAQAARRWRRPLASWPLALAALTFLAVAGCSYETTDFPVRATVLEASGGEGSVPSTRAGALLGAGQSVRTGGGASDRTLISLVPGTLVALGAGSEVVLEELRLTKRDTELRGRHAALNLRAGTLDVLITAPERAAPSTVLVRTPMGELLAASGCLLRIVVHPARVTVLCARGSSGWGGGELVPAGSLRTMVFRPEAEGGERPGAVVPTTVRAAASPDAQGELSALLEMGARLQSLELLRQGVPPGWRLNRTDG